MAKEKYNEEDGVWRTIGGRKVFIRKGQSVADAMIESGKFKATKTKGGLRETYRKQIHADKHKQIMDLIKEGKPIPDELITKYDEVDENKPTMREEYRKENEEDIKEANKLKSQKKSSEYFLKNPTRMQDNEALQSQLEEAKQGLKDVNKRLNENAKQKLNESREERQAKEQERINAQLKKERESWTDDDYIKRHHDIQDMKKKAQETYEKQVEEARMSGNDRLEESARKGREEDLRNIDKLEKENRANYDEYRKNKKEKLYNDDDDDFIKEAKLLDAKDKGKINDEELFNEQARIYGKDPEKEKERVKANLDRLGVERPDFLKDKSSKDPVKDTLEMYGIKDFKGQLEDKGYNVKKDEQGGLSISGKKSTNDYAYKTPEQAKAELGWGHHNLTDKEAVEKKFGKSTNDLMTNKELQKQIGDDLEKSFGKLSSTNETMNNAIREKASNKNKEYESLINNFYALSFGDSSQNYEDVKDVPFSKREKAVKSALYMDDNDILDRFGEDYGYDNNDKLKNLKSQIDYMRNPGETINQTAKRLASGGDFLIYNGDMEDYLKLKGIKYNDDNMFDKYTQDMADRVEKLYNQSSNEKMNDTIRSQANMRNEWKQYLKDHPESKMSLSKFKNMKK